MLSSFLPSPSCPCPCACCGLRCVALRGGAVELTKSEPTRSLISSLLSLILFSLATSYLVLNSSCDMLPFCLFAIPILLASCLPSHAKRADRLSRVTPASFSSSPSLPFFAFLPAFLFYFYFLAAAWHGTDHDATHSQISFRTPFDLPRHHLLPSSFFLVPPLLRRLRARVPF
ncbi:hypothetical protein C8R45DRAFT_435090 [Mycena sanguinolenta]|nr:hypothetical protein C8R45DRAFT_435090 [Mycena sanguinolenta]